MKDPGPGRSPIEAMMVWTAYKCPKCGHWNDLKKRKHKDCIPVLVTPIKPKRSNKKEGK